MTALSSAGWVVHDVGLAAAIGGPLFEMSALAPVLEHSDVAEADRISVDAAQRYSLIKLASHVAFAVPWFIGRSMRSGREVSAHARMLTKTKDVLIGVSLVSGIIGLISVKRARDRVEQEGGAIVRGRQPRVPTKAGAVGALGFINMMANVGILGITALLAMEGTKSVRFSASSRRLP
jgi:hypothetical protein